jgi:hypothetical protein
MHPTPRTLLVRALVVALVVAAFATLTPAGAQALTVDDVPQARRHIVGSHITNHHTHLETWIVGFYRYRREVRIHGHWRAKRFYGLRVSAQRCDRSHCWGRTLGGKLWSPHQPGRRLRSSRTADRTAGRSAASARADLCLQGTTVCAAPWNWFSRYIDLRQRELVRRFVDPCARGGLAGGGVVAVKDLSARILFEGGVLTAARAASVFEGPPGIALGALAGCMVGEGSGGVKTVTALVSALNPFDRGARADG